MSTSLHVLFSLHCVRCDEVIFLLGTRHAVKHIAIGLEGEVFVTCGACGHTTSYLHTEEDGTIGGPGMIPTE